MKKIFKVTQTYFCFVIAHDYDEAKTRFNNDEELYCSEFIEFEVVDEQELFDQFEYDLNNELSWDNWCRLGCLFVFDIISPLGLWKNLNEVFMDIYSFVMGYLFCMLADVVFSIANYFVQRAMFYRHKNKKIKEKESEKRNES